MLRRCSRLLSSNVVGVTRGDGVLRVTIQRPEVKNAFNADVIKQLTDVFRQVNADIEKNPDDVSVRCVVLTGEGDAFSAGADLNWMKAMKTYTLEEQRRDALALFGVFDAIANCSVPVIARVNGHAMGGGVGLVAAADVAYSVDGALFGLTEVNLGLIPSAISPFVARKIGVTAALRYFTTGERFGATEATRISLLSAPPVADEAALEAAVAKTVKAYSNAAPKAVRAAKVLARRYEPVPAEIEGSPLGPYLANLIAGIRVGDEAQDGMSAFLEKRKPSWIASKAV